MDVENILLLCMLFDCCQLVFHRETILLVEAVQFGLSMRFQLEELFVLELFGKEEVVEGPLLFAVAK